ncbi:shikimate dehydrogenase [Fodinibius salinus]|uniref:Shikimate dehydrogenase (NADP(+)) n=1 Tax=Fodinibius salinus TaxID=860790 RepID=A0A5D3YMT1_9BACT|nr:shikimate dehydrogenase [Fodinibius salinus]TYP95097.1 shikimate dehydrogenase [Fodinibius salinus]
MNLTNFLQSDRADNPHYLLLGHPVEHSWSPLMHNTALKFYDMSARYFAVDLQNNEFSRLSSYLNSPTFLGANVTIPYKQMISDYLDDTDTIAKDIGAVNTIVKESGRLWGANTDCVGFTAPLESLEHQLKDGSAIVFGTGGAAKAVVAGLEKKGIEEIYLISRNPHSQTFFNDYSYVNIESYHSWTTFADETAIIVNTTPLGMHPKVNESPVRESEKESLANSICYDLVYNPLETTFLQQAQSVGAETISGLEMLIHQGSRSFEYWTGRPFPIGTVREKLYEQLKN